METASTIIIEKQIMFLLNTKNNYSSKQEYSGRQGWITHTKQNFY